MRLERTSAGRHRVPNRTNGPHRNPRRWTVKWRPMANRIKLTPEKRASFLDILADGQSVTAAAEAIGVARRGKVIDHDYERKPLH